MKTLSRSTRAKYGINKINVEIPENTETVIIKRSFTFSEPYGEIVGYLKDNQTFTDWIRENIWKTMSHNSDKETIAVRQNTTIGRYGILHDTYNDCIYQVAYI